MHMDWFPVSSLEPPRFCFATLNVQLDQNKFMAHFGCRSGVKIGGSLS
jgi:hypothetical protein